MRSLYLFCLFFLNGITGSSQSFKKSIPSDSSYVAGVVEFQPAAFHTSNLDQLNNNLRGHLDTIRSAEAVNTDIIVFPENALYNLQYPTFVPHPKDKIIPCENSTYEPFFQGLSCGVKEVRKYVVVNLLEKEICTNESQAEHKDPRPCAKNGLSTFNTNVVFDRDGTVIARYRKYNSYGEVVNVTYLPELSTFDTDFGVRFGMFICFDINFYSPAMSLVKMGVKDFIYTTFWYSELPFLTAVQLQQSWAYANDVNLLAAGASVPSGGSTGSGIYGGKQGALVSIMARSPERKLYISNVTKTSLWGTHRQSFPTHDNTRAERKLNGLRLMREYRMDNFTSDLLEQSNGINFEKELCHASFCCKFSWRLKHLVPTNGSSSYQFHLAVFDGDRQYSGNGYTKYKLCAVYACIEKHLSSCGRVFDDEILVSPEFVFESLAIEGQFPQAEKLLIMPNSLSQDLYPLTVHEFEFSMKEEKNFLYVKHTLLKPSDDLLTFGIYANYYDGNSGSNIMQWNAHMAATMIGTLLTICLFLRK